MASDLVATEARLGQRVVEGGATLVALTVGLHALAALRLFVLARLLDPLEFGLVGSAQALLVLLDALSGLSVQGALVRSRTLRRELLDTAWTLEVARGVLQSALVFLLAPGLGAFVGAPQATAVARAMAVVPLLAGLLNVGVADFTRELRIGRYCLLQLGAALADFGVAIALAIALHSAWALVAGSVALNACRTALSFALHPFRPRLAMDREAARELLAFGRWTLAASAFAWVLNSGVPLVIGRLLGLPALGVYQMAWKVVSIPIQDLGRAAAQVTLPAYAAIRDQPERVASALARVSRVVAMLLLPAIAWIAASHEALVAVVLGPRWSAAGPLLTVLAVAAAARCGTSLLMPLARAVGRTWKEAAVAAVELVVVAAIFLPLLRRSGGDGAAAAVAAGACFGLVAAIALVPSGVGIEWRILARALAAPLLASAPVSLVAGPAMGAAPGWASLLFSGVAATVAFGAGLLALDHLIPPPLTVRCLLSAGWSSVRSAVGGRPLTMTGPS